LVKEIGERTSAKGFSGVGDIFIRILDGKCDRLSATHDLPKQTDKEGMEESAGRDRVSKDPTQAPKKVIDDARGWLLMKRGTIRVEFDLRLINMDLIAKSVRTGRSDLFLSFWGSDQMALEKKEEGGRGNGRLERESLSVVLGLSRT